ncbi:MAG: 5'-nucleotidase C-terminal domain-containing protein [Aureispira sp.]
MTRLLVLLYSITFLMACQPQMHFCRTESNNAGITEVKEQDDKIVAMIAPYKKQLGQEMDAKIGEVAKTLTKALPESTLGNWSADVVQVIAKKYTKETVDFTVLNYGGLRIPSLPKGPLTKGKIYELMPFDNYIVLVKMKGAELSQLFNHVAVKGGWPISGELKLVIDGEKATQVLLNGKPLDANKEYHVATNDYLAKGGDQCAFFVNKEKIKTGILIRDAMIEYVKNTTTPIDANIEGRITKK